MWNVLTDLRQSVRTLLRSPGYSAVAVLTVALAIGANTLLFSIANPLIARPLPLEDPGTLGWVWTTNMEQGVTRGRVSLAEFLDWRKSVKSFTALAGMTTRGATLSGLQRDAERIQLMCVTANLVEVWGLRPALGRLFQPGEDAPGRPLVGVLSHSFWRDRFQSDPSVINRVVLLDGQPVTVIGVMQPEIEIGNLTENHMWVPVPLETTRPRDERMLRVMGRLAPGASVASAAAEMAALAGNQAHDYPKSNTNWSATVVTTKTAMTGGDTWVILGMLGVVVGFVLLIACANLANLVLARVISRNQDLAVRLSLGASRLQLIRPLLLECLIVGLAGGVAGLGLAQAGVRVITAVAHEQFLKTLTIDGYVLAFTAILSIVTPILFSLWPALVAGRAATADTLRDARSSGGGKRAQRRRSVLVGSQVALALSLLAVSSLTVQSMLNFQRINLGMDVRHTMMFTIELPRDRYPTDVKRERFARDVVEGLMALPGVTAGATTTMPVFIPDVPRTLTGTKHDGQRETERPWAAWYAVTPDFFRAAAIGQVAGRALTDADRAGSQPVAVINRTAADKYFDGPDGALNRSIVIAGRGDADRTVTVVGVVADTKNSQVTETSPQIWVPFAQWPAPSFTVLVSSGDPDARAADVRTVVRRVDALVAPSTPRTLLDAIEDDISSARIINGMLTGFALLALILAASGLYGAVSYSVGQRRSEIGVRMALGAAPGTIRRMVLREGLRVTLIGAAIGLVVGVLLARASASAFYGVEAYDPVTFAAVTGTVLLVAVAAIWTPAVRAMRVDPARSLRAN